MHPSWRNFEPVSLTAVGRWEVTLDDDAQGWVTRGVFANDVRLVEVVAVAGGRGLGFSVASDGKVTP